MWTRWRCRRCNTSIPSLLQGKHRQAVSTKAARCSSGCENLKRYKNAEKKQEVQYKPAGEEGRFEEDRKMEVEEVDTKKKLDQRKKQLQKQLRDIEKFTDMCQSVVDEHKEKWQQELQDTEQKRNDLLPEDQSMQKRSPKLQSLQDKKETMPKGLCNGDMERIRDEIAERERGSAPRTGTKVPEHLLGRRRVGRRNPTLSSRRTKTKQLCVAVQRTRL